MRIVELQPEIDPGQIAREQSGLVRSPGIHVSDVIRHIENTVTKKGKRPPTSELSRDEIRRMGNYTSVGWAWEAVLRTSLTKVWYEDYIVPVGEIECDGLTGTPDGLNTEEVCVEEFKATWRSSRRSRDLEGEFWSWMVQIKAYCHMLALLEARLRVFFVNGNYRSSGPEIKVWALSFTREELKQNWKMLLVGAESLRKHNAINERG